MYPVMLHLLILPPEVEGWRREPAVAAVSRQPSARIRAPDDSCARVW